MIVHIILACLLLAWLSNWMPGHILLTSLMAWTMIVLALLVLEGCMTHASYKTPKEDSKH